MRTVGELLGNKSREFVSIPPSTLVCEAIKTLAIGKHGALPVVSEERLLGIFSERDYVRKIASKNRSQEIAVSEVMTPNPISVSKNHSLEDCMHIFTERGFRHLPVLEGEKLIGILSINDVTKGVLIQKERMLNEALQSGLQREHDLQSSHEETIKKISNLEKSVLTPIQGDLENLKQSVPEKFKSSVDHLKSSVKEIQRLFEPISKQYEETKALTRKKILLGSTDPKVQIMAKMALGGTGLELDLVGSLDEGKKSLSNDRYDILCVGSDLIELTQIAHEKDPQTKTVLMTREETAEYLPKIKKFPFLSNIISLSESDRAFAVRTMLTTVSKLSSGNLFGIEKYLNWGVDIREREVTCSDQRTELLEEMKSHLKTLGIRSRIREKCATVAEELLMNAIYDAPVNENGKTIYNHLDRKVKVDLKENQKPIFRYACDGVLVGISCVDPFGSFKKETIINYLEYNLQGNADILQEKEKKGGAGRGLFMITSLAHLTVFNVLPGRKTEASAFFSVDLNEAKNIGTNSLHYFGES